MRWSSVAGLRNECHSPSYSRLPDLLWDNVTLVVCPHNLSWEEVCLFGICHFEQREISLFVVSSQAPGLPCSQMGSRDKGSSQENKLISTSPEFPSGAQVQKLIQPLFKNAALSADFFSPSLPPSLCLVWTRTDSKMKVAGRGCFRWNSENLLAVFTPSAENLAIQSFWFSRFLSLIFNPFTSTLFSLSLPLSQGGLLILCPRAQNGDGESGDAWKRGGRHWHWCDLRDPSEEEEEEEEHDDAFLVLWLWLTTPRAT